jgi:1-acyl-sn-glycerol-3-phosphate acyltransferase
LSPSSLPEPRPAGWLKRTFIRYGIRFFVRLYLRVKFEGWENIPADPPYLLNFNHPSWVDPFLVVAFWPRRHRLFIFGPKEEDMRVGWRNRLIAWGRIGVPFKPSRTDLIDTTRRATGVIKAGYVLAIAGEGRLSDREGEIVPLQEGAAFFSLRTGVPIVPLGFIGTRWVRFGKRVTMRVGPAILPGERKANREGMDSLTAELREAMERLLAGADDEQPPGRFARWITELFADRPWLNEPPATEPPPTEPPPTEPPLTEPPPTEPPPTTAADSPAYVAPRDLSSNRPDD